MRTTTNHIRVAVAGLVLFTSSVRLLPMLPAAHAAPAIKSEAKAKLTKGGELYKQGRYDDAVSEFLTGYSIDPAPVFLYALGQAERKKGDCAKANEYYKSFLQTSPGAAQAQAAETQIKRCEEQLAAEKNKHVEPPATTAITTAPTERPMEPPTVPAPQQPEPAGSTFASSPENLQIDRVPWYKDIWGGVLLGSGLAAIGVGAWLFTSAGSDEESAAKNAPDYLSYSKQVSDAEGKRNLSIILLSAGGALTAGAIIRYVLVDRSAPPPVAKREIRFAPTLGGLRVWGRF